MKQLERILHIEDDVSIQEIARVALEVLGGFMVLTCASGAAGLAAVASFQPELILLDVMMPEMDGPETLRQLQQMQVLAACPVVFMTAKIQPAEIDEYKRLGAADVIVKPFDPMTLSDQLRHIWRTWHGQG
ncbi:response regulator [Pseudomonas saliphila]|uniref:response regulator n=1 Tax=Pseudomonas saliphila TaxID=2586906 RepID=UPI00123A3092|nr:response regulator [Pseudomonas saliphila]